MKILTVLGARPQFIKAGSVSRVLSTFDDIQEVIIHTGQHYDSNMSNIFFDEMKIPEPNYFLGVGGISHGAMTGRMIELIEAIVLKESPDWMLVYGDTNSTLAGSIVASKLQVKLAHVEAGLRSYNMAMPEEINRILTDRVSDILFCPTDTAIANLHDEGFDYFDCTIVKSGDVMRDGALFYAELAVKPDIFIPERYVLCTIHRAENTSEDSMFQDIFSSLEEIAKDISVVVPLHPRTRKKFDGLNMCAKNIHFIEPVGYLEMIWLIQCCNMVITDSGGLQKEAFFFSKPCITLRDETEWVELIDNRYNVLANPNSIIHLFKKFKFNNNFSRNLYGNGDASHIIVNQLLSHG